jgi:hypothetical protein
MGNTSENSKKLSVRRIVWYCVLLFAAGAVFLALRKPTKVASRQPAASVEANAASFETKLNELSQPPSANTGVSSSEVRLTAEEISAAITKANSSGDLASAIAKEAPDEIPVGEPLVTLEGDVVKGQFASEIGGKRVYLTVAGHLGAKDGYATFDPTEFKVGDLSVPVSLVNGALQKKLDEQKDRLKLPDFVGDLKVQNGELVIRPK